jgi:CheY-like chemotaxis protein
LIGENIELEWCPSETPLSVKMDPVQIDQLLVNLCVNARDAITDVGKITIETTGRTIDAEYCVDHAESFPGDFAILTVTDNGSGMDRETLSKIFDPFFTTKKLGKGTGLGLATVYGIVKQNNGFIDVYSEQSKGTSFRIYVPLYSGRPAPEIETRQTTGASGRGESILVVEDEAATLKMTKKMLSQLGYTVKTAETPYEALSLAREHAANLSLLITDVIMPEMNGRELAEQIQTICPGIKRLYMSGYTANVITHQQILDENVFFLQKPFSKTELSAKVRTALDSENEI